MQCHLLFLFLSSILWAGFGLTAKEKSCTKYFTKDHGYDNYMTVNIEQGILKHLPLYIYFSHSILYIESNVVNSEEVNSRQWKLTSKATNISSSNMSDSFIRIFHNGDDLAITRLESVVTLCNDEDTKARDFDTHGNKPNIEPIFIPACGRPEGDHPLNPEEILERKAKWGTGRNYLVQIPSYETFVGYVVDLFFTNPIIDITGFTDSIKAKKYDEFHWALTRESTERACRKLVSIFFTISYDKESDVKAMLFNGVPLIGNGKSLAYFKNENIDKAINTDCEKYFVFISSWHGEEKGKKFNFSAPIQSDEPQIGIVVEFVFEKAIQILKVWEVTPKTISGNHWRVHNEGFVVPAYGTVTIPMIILYTDHYHVKTKGIKLNGKVLCGLGSSVFLDGDEKDFPEMKPLRNYNSRVGGFRGSLLAIIILVSISMVISIVALSSVLIRKLRAIQKNRKHLFDFPARELPLEMDNDTASLDHSINTAETTISHM